MIDPRIKALVRFKNKNFLKGRKADLHVGGLEDFTGGSKVAECQRCGRTVFLADSYEEIADMVKKKHGIICPYCLVKSYTVGSVSEELLQAMKMAIAHYEEVEK